MSAEINKMKLNSDFFEEKHLTCHQLNEQKNKNIKCNGIQKGGNFEHERS